MLPLALGFALLSSATTGTSTAADGWRVGFEVGKGFVLEHEDDMKLALRLRGQFLYAVAAEDGDGGHAVQLRRVRVAFEGHVFGPETTYKMELAVSPRDVGITNGGPSTSSLLDLYFRFSHIPGVALQVGQYKVPFSRERVTSSGNLVLVDRSIANAEFNVDRDVGFDLRTKDAFGLGVARYYLGAYSGKGRNSFEPSKFDYMLLGRIEILPLGLFKDYVENDTKRTAEPKLSIGAAYAFVDDAARDRGIRGATFDDGATMDFHNATADVLFLWRGYALFGALHLRRGRRADGDPGTPRNGWGWTIQPAYLLPNLDLEFTARFADLASRGSSRLPLRRSVGGGVSYYFVAHSWGLRVRARGEPSGLRTDLRTEERAVGERGLRSCADRVHRPREVAHVDHRGRRRKSQCGPGARSVRARQRPPRPGEWRRPLLPDSPGLGGHREANPGRRWQEIDAHPRCQGDQQAMAK